MHAGGDAAQQHTGDGATLRQTVDAAVCPTGNIYRIVMKFRLHIILYISCSISSNSSNSI